MKTLLIATQNRHKAEEIGELLAGLEVRVVTLAEVAPELEIDETGDTFMANARLKAVAAAQATGLLTLADDSGLDVDALGGEPGVHSKRFAESDPARIAKLLRLLQEVPDVQRSARFHCAVVLADPATILAEIEETVEGHLLRAPRGASGFGYDPIFLPDEAKWTMAELSMEEKNAISHRGKAFRRAAEGLRDLFNHERHEKSEKHEKDLKSG